MGKLVGVAESALTAGGDFGAMSHTILLVQPTERPEGRTYADYVSVNECMEGVYKIMKEHLKRMNPKSLSHMISVSCLILLMTWHLPCLLS